MRDVRRGGRGVFCNWPGWPGLTAGSIAEFVGRDRDLPPHYSGEAPETFFRSFEKAVRLWQWETDIPEKKQGAKLLRALSGTAKLAVEDMELDEAATTEGVKNIMAGLRDFYKPHLEIALPRAFKTAVYGHINSRRSLSRSQMEQLATSSHRHASLTEQQDHKVLTWTEGRYTRSHMVAAFRKLDKAVIGAHQVNLLRRPKPPWTH